MDINSWYTVFVLIQLIHSQEEIHMHFNDKSPVFKIRRKPFLILEALFSLFIICWVFVPISVVGTIWKHIFILLMFGNGVEHLLWAYLKKGYVPGLVTGFILFIEFILYYFIEIVI